LLELVAGELSGLISEYTMGAMEGSGQVLGVSHDAWGHGCHMVAVHRDLAFEYICIASAWTYWT